MVNDLIRERQAEGIIKAKAKGVYKGRKRVLDDAQVAELRAQAQAGVQIAKLARDYSISRQTVYNYLSSSNAMMQAAYKAVP